MSASLSTIRNIPGLRAAFYRLRLVTDRYKFAANGIRDFIGVNSKDLAPRPDITAVVVGRNDDYMPDFAARLFATVDWNLKYLVREVVFVEWNPPVDRPYLSEELTRRFENVRCFIVSREIHQRICKNPSIKLLEYHAKNVGVRRAASPWVMATNADAAVSFDSVRRLRSAPLQPDVVWTAERVDIPWKENRQTEIGITDTLRYRRIIPYNSLGTGEFVLASAEIWNSARGYDEMLEKHRIGCDIRGTSQMVSRGARIKRVGRVLHLTHPTSCTESIQPHHGEMATLEGVPYDNPPEWGLANSPESPVSGRVWIIEDKVRENLMRKNG
jgi:hypothetical protein